MRRTPSPPDQAPQSALARLLEVESRLEATLEQVRLEGEAALLEAKQQAAARADALALELAAADAELSASLVAAAGARIAEEEAALAGVRARYEGVGEADVDAHASWLIGEVLRLAAGGSR